MSLKSLLVNETLFFSSTDKQKSSARPAWLIKTPDEEETVRHYLKTQT